MLNSASTAASNGQNLIANNNTVAQVISSNQTLGELYGSYGAERNLVSGLSLFLQMSNQLANTNTKLAKLTQDYGIMMEQKVQAEKMAIDALTQKLLAEQAFKEDLSRALKVGQEKKEAQEEKKRVETARKEEAEEARRKLETVNKQIQEAKKEALEAKANEKEEQEQILKLQEALELSLQRKKEVEEKYRRIEEEIKKHESVVGNAYVYRSGLGIGNLEEKASSAVERAKSQQLDETDSYVLGLFQLYIMDTVIALSNWRDKQENNNYSIFIDTIIAIVISYRQSGPVGRVFSRAVESSYNFIRVPGEGATVLEKDKKAYEEQLEEKRVAALAAFKTDVNSPYKDIIRKLDSYRTQDANIQGQKSMKPHQIEAELDKMGFLLYAKRPNPREKAIISRSTIYAKQFYISYKLKRGSASASSESKATNNVSKATSAEQPNSRNKTTMIQPSYS